MTCDGEGNPVGSPPVNPTSRPALSDVIMAAAWRVAPHSAFGVGDLLGDAELAAACPLRHRVHSQAAYLAGTGWLTVVAGHPEPRWALSEAWRREFERRQAAQEEARGAAG